jgi:hypothetical protein
VTNALTVLRDQAERARNLPAMNVTAKDFQRLQDQVDELQFHSMRQFNAAAGLETPLRYPPRIAKEQMPLTKSRLTELTGELIEMLIFC